MTLQTPDSLRWGSYLKFEGPYSHGTQPYVCPDDPSMTDKILSTITATEGGNWNALNMYDSCILTMGLIQWCDAAYFAVTDMLSACFQHDPSLLDPLQPAMTKSGALFVPTDKGYRFKLGSSLVITRSKQIELYFRGASGEKGGWSKVASDHARLWGACVANVFDNPVAIEVQKDWTVNRLDVFVLPFAKSIIQQAPHTNLGDAFRCAYYSFAANNPSWANSNLSAAIANSSNVMYSLPWFEDVLKQLTFGSGCAIYPNRYNKIRPVLERFFSIDLPDFATDLQQWNGRLKYPLCSVSEVQSALVQLGFNLGKSGPNHDGVDGVDGKKTHRATYDFQGCWNIDQTGLVDQATHLALHDAVQGLVDSSKGLAIDSDTEAALARLRAKLEQV
jgi:hypothetical protein